MGVLRYSMWIDASPIAVWNVFTNLIPQGAGTQLSLEARTRWPRGLRPLGRVVEVVLLNPREANRELGNLKAIVEREIQPPRPR